LFIAALVLYHVGPVVGTIVTSAALVLDWDTSVGDAVLFVVEARAPEQVVVLVEDVLLGEGVLGELQITLEELALAGAGPVLGLEGVSLGGEAVCVADELADAHVAVGLADTLLAVLVGLALVVEGVDWLALAHVGHGAVAEHQTVAAVGPVLALVELLLAGQTGLAEELGGDSDQIIVATLLALLEVATFARAGRWATDRGAVRPWAVPFVIVDDGCVVGDGDGNESSGEFYLFGWSVDFSVSLELLLEFLSN